MAVLFNTVQVGPTKDGKQTITLPSEKRGAYVSCNTTPEKVDEYMSSRKNIEKDTNQKSGILLGLGTLAGMAIGALAIKSKDAKMYEKLGFGGITGCFVGFLGALGLAEYGTKQIEKLNDKFISENS